MRWMHPRIESLHNHTTLSDGLLDHQSLFSLASNKGIGVLAFTDHDALPSPETVQRLRSQTGVSTEWVIGIELTSRLPIENGAIPFHMIGLFVDPSNKDLLAHCKDLQRGRKEKVKGMVSHLRELGFRITEEDCFSRAKGESVGRPHVVEALQAHPENNLIMNRLLDEMRESSLHDSLLQQQYEDMLSRGERGYPYRLFLSPIAFKPMLLPDIALPSLDEAAGLIRSAGGIAILAHYFAYKRFLPLKSVQQLLESKRLDGAEVVYAIHGDGIVKVDEIEQDRRNLRDIVAETHSLASGGGDIHTEADIDYYTQNTPLNEGSFGLTKNIISSGKVDLRWSSFGDNSY